MTLKITTEQTIEVDDWDELVQNTYGRPYNFQQQDGCKDRGREYISVPEYPEDYERDTLPEVVNHGCHGVSFAAWLARDPKQPLNGDAYGEETWTIDMWWGRNFYPHVSMIANDLHARGLLPAGEYAIVIDW